VTLDEQGNISGLPPLPPSVQADVKTTLTARQIKMPKVLEADQADAIERVKRQHPNSHLTLGILYAPMGVLDDAEQEFQALLNANPKSSVAQ
jgi:hypothetical protein